MNILGINAYHGDASAALVVDGQLVAAVEEERFTRVKHDTALPPPGDPLLPGRSRHQPRRHRPLRACPATLERTSGSGSPTRSRTGPADVWPRSGPRTCGRSSARSRRSLKGSASRESNLKAKAHFVEHHLAHIGSSFYVSPFERAAVLSIDGFGDMISAMWGVGEGDRLRIAGRGGVPTLAGRLLHGRHAVPRVPQVRRRVQGDGSRLLRRARAPRRSSAGSCAATAWATTSAWRTSDTTSRARR